jgi:hypothetical protein
MNNCSDAYDSDTHGADSHARRARQLVICVFCLVMLAVVTQLPVAAQEATPVQTPLGETLGEHQQSDAPSSSMFSTEVWLTPLVLLPGVALLIVSTSARFGQLHGEFHRLLDLPHGQAKVLSHQLMRRCVLFRNSLVALYASVGLFAFGSLLGGVVNLWQPESLWVVGGATMIGIGCVVFAAIQLVREAVICLDVLVDDYEALQKQLPQQ